MPDWAYGFIFMRKILDCFKELTGGLLNQDVMDLDYRKVIIDEQSIETTKKYSSRYRSSQRLGKGLFFTDEEKEKKKKELASIELP